MEPGACGRQPRPLEQTAAAQAKRQTSREQRGLGPWARGGNAPFRLASTRGQEETRNRFKMYTQTPGQARQCTSRAHTVLIGISKSRQASGRDAPQQTTVGSHYEKLVGVFTRRVLKRRCGRQSLARARAVKQELVEAVLRTTCIAAVPTRLHPRETISQVHARRPHSTCKSWYQDNGVREYMRWNRINICSLTRTTRRHATYRN